MSSSKSRKVMVPPINLIYKVLQQQVTVQIWLYEQIDCRIEGKIRGFDEFMNLVIDDAVEIHAKKDQRRQLGRILLKGENVTLIAQATGRVYWANAHLAFFRQSITTRDV